MSELGPGHDIPRRVEAARKAMEERLFFEKFDDFVRTKLRVLNSRETKYGRENIVGVGVGWKNWPEGLRLREEDYSRLLPYYRNIKNFPFGFYDWFKSYEYYCSNLYFHILHDAKRFRKFGELCVRVLVNRKAPEKLVEPSVVVSPVMRDLGFDVLTDVVEVGEVVLASNKLYTDQ